MMAVPELSTRESEGQSVAMKTRISPTWIARARSGSIGLGAAAATFSAIVLTPPSYGDAAQIVAAADPVEANRAQVPASVNPENVSCKELKDKLESAGSLTILSGPKGWGDTFYGPRVPQCQFWTRPVFSYVSTRDGLCGVGYICVEKLGAAGGGQ
jgi:hypothetical protein